MSYLRDVFFIFSLICITINNITSFKQTHLFFVWIVSLKCFLFLFLEYLLLFLDDDVYEERKDSKSSVLRCCLAFTWFFANFSLVLLIKVLLIEVLLIKSAHFHDPIVFYLGYHLCFVFLEKEYIENHQYCTETLDRTHTKYQLATFWKFL